MIAENLLSRLGRLFGVRRYSHLNLTWLKREGWLGSNLTGTIPQAPRAAHIESLARVTNSLGPQRLAAEYGEAGGMRTPDVVRSLASCGDLYAWLVQQRKPSTVIEFGSAFGVSGMYFCAGLEAVHAGHLYTFEINREWADIAERNIGTVSKRFTLTRGAFEDQVSTVVMNRIDLAFIDGIHTYDFVMRQFDVLKPRMAKSGLIAFDDIDFHRPGARMREAWEEIAGNQAVIAAVEVNGRVGLVELS